MPDSASDYRSSRPDDRRVSDQETETSPPDSTIDTPPSPSVNSAEERITSTPPETTTDHARTITLPTAYVDKTSFTYQIQSGAVAAASGYLFKLAIESLSSRISKWTGWGSTARARGSQISQGESYDDAYGGFDDGLDRMFDYPSQEQATALALEKARRALSSAGGVSMEDEGYETDTRRGQAGGGKGDGRGRDRDRREDDSEDGSEDSESDDGYASE